MYEKQMTPGLLTKYQAWLELCHKNGINPELTCVVRTPQVQLALVLQGRTIEQSLNFLKGKLPTANAKVKPFIRPLINRLEISKAVDSFVFCNTVRKEAGLSPVNKDDWYIVTCTVNSKHYPDNNGQGKAFDFCFPVPGHEWDIKLDSNKTGGPDFDEAGKYAGLVGLKWGGIFGDRPHCEDK